MSKDLNVEELRELFSKLSTAVTWLQRVGTQLSSLTSIADLYVREDQPELLNEISHSKKVLNDLMKHAEQQLKGNNGNS